MSHPRIRKLRESEEKVISLAETERLIYKGFTLMRYEWGIHNNKVAFLVHGWEGQTGNFASLISTLLRFNYKVVSFDAPSHGKSSDGKTNMFEFAKILKPYFEDYQPELVISHSFGSVNVAKILRLTPEINIKLWILVTTPNNFKSRLNQIASQFGLGKNIVQKLIHKTQNDTNENIDDLNMVTYCKELNNINKALIIHSKTDKVLPIEGAREVHKSFRQSEIIELENYGHYTILWSEELKEIVVNRLENI